MFSSSTNVEEMYAPSKKKGEISGEKGWTWAHLSWSFLPTKQQLWLMTSSSIYLWIRRNTSYFPKKYISSLHRWYNFPYINKRYQQKTRKFQGVLQDVSTTTRPEFSYLRSQNPEPRAACSMRRRLAVARSKGGRILKQTCSDEYCISISFSDIKFHPSVHENLMERLHFKLHFEWKFQPFLYNSACPKNITSLLVSQSYPRNLWSLRWSLQSVSFRTGGSTHLRVSSFRSLRKTAAFWTPNI